MHFYEFGELWEREGGGGGFSPNQPRTTKVPPRGVLYDFLQRLPTFPMGAMEILVNIEVGIGFFHPYYYYF